MTMKGPSFLRGLEGPGKLRVRSDRGGNGVSWRHIIATLGTKKIVRYDLEENTVVASYFIPSFMSLSSPLCYDNIVGAYVCAINGRTIISWDGVETRLEVLAGFETDHLSAAEGGLEKNQDGNFVFSLKSGVQIVDALDFQGQVYFLMENGRIHTLTYLKTHGDEMEAQKPLLPLRSIRLSSRLRFDADSSTLFLDHLYSCSRDNEAVEEFFVSSFPVVIDPETGDSLVGNGRTVQLHLGLKENKVSCISLVGNRAVYAGGDGHLRWRSLDETVRGHIDIAGTEKVDLMKVCFLEEFDVNRVCVIGDRKDGEGSSVALVDLVYSEIIGNVKVKSVHETDGSPLVCHGGHVVLFKHGQKVAGLEVDNLPTSLADFIGKRSFESKKDGQEDRTKKKSLPKAKWQSLDTRSQPVELYTTVPTILKEGDVAGVCHVLKTYTDIPELLLLNIIEMLLMVNEEKFTKTGQDRHGLLDMAFSVMMAETLMVQHLRMTRFDVVKAMLTHVMEMMLRADGSSTHQLLAWNSLILNSHYPNFIMLEEEESKDLLECNLKLIEHLEMGGNSLGTMLSTVKNIMDGRLVKAPNHNTGYSIEILML